jgi:hypothetical protein
MLKNPDDTEQGSRFSRISRRGSSRKPVMTPMLCFSMAARTGLEPVHRP